MADHLTCTTGPPDHGLWRPCPFLRVSQALSAAALRFAFSSFARRIAQARMAMPLFSSGQFATTKPARANWKGKPVASAFTPAAQVAADQGRPGASDRGRPAPELRERLAGDTQVVATACPLIFPLSSCWRLPDLR